MNGTFYDESISYEQNFQNGPPLEQNSLKPPVRELTPEFAKSESRHTFLGFPINLPFGIPAGPLLNSQYVKHAFAWGYDVVHYKTQRSTVFPCNEFPNVLFVDVDGDLTLDKAAQGLVGKKTTEKKPTEFSITNSFGNPSLGPQFWQEDLKVALTYQKPGQLLIASVVGTIKPGALDEDYYNDFAYTASLAKDTGVKVIEINLSCPNVASEGILCYTPSAVEAIVRKTKKAIGNTSLLAKIGYFEPEQQDLLENIVRRMLPYIEGIAAINTIPAPVVDEKGNQALPGPNRLSSGICGASIKWAGLDMVKRLARIRAQMNADFEIVGVGGVMTPNDYFDYRDAGANLVQSATGAMWNPSLANEIWQKEIKSSAQPNLSAIA